MAFWSPPTSADPDLKQQLFDFKVRLFFFSLTQLSEESL
jgi:hypothetical protein